MIEALRHYANAALGNNAAYRVWDSREQHVEEVLATASLILVGKAAFAAAIEQYPGVRLTLRHGIRVIDKT
ncbi:MAG: hypothetical protein JO105_12350 [Hyphomicrobiales bacterium]|nr:hypothetical protein [Hyphomicrobiales bacterium]